MPYAPLDDRFDEHRKYYDYGMAELGLIAAAITMSTRMHFDGMIPRSWPGRRFGEAAQPIVDRLLSDGIWKIRPDGNYEIVGFLEHNPRWADVQAKLQRKVEIAQLGGRRSAEARKSTSGSTSGSTTGSTGSGSVGSTAGSTSSSTSEEALVEAPCVEHTAQHSTTNQGRSTAEKDPGSQPGSLQPEPPNHRQTLLSPEPAAPVDSNESTSAQVREVFDYWAAKQAALRGVSISKIKLTSDRRIKISARLKDRYTVEDIKRGVDGVFANKFNTDGGYTDIELVCRNASHLDRYMNWANIKPKVSNGRVVQGGDRDEPWMPTELKRSTR